MLEILHEDNHCLAVNKPAGVLSQGDATGDPSVVDRSGDYLKVTYAKPGNVYVGLVHRLDRPTSGVVLVARTSKGAARLSEQFRDGLVEKTYLAVAEGAWPDDSGEWSDWLVKDERTNVVTTAEPTHPVPDGCQPGLSGRRSRKPASSPSNSGRPPVAAISSGSSSPPGACRSWATGNTGRPRG